MQMEKNRNNQDTTKLPGGGSKSFLRPSMRQDDTAPELDSTKRTWGRDANFVGPTVSWQDRAAGKVDDATENPKRPDFAAPSNSASDVIGLGEDETTPFSAQPGIMPDPKKKENWA